MSRSIVQEKSFAFAVEIVRFSRRLQSDHKEFVLSKQLLRSGTSIGANVEEALGGQSGKDFLSKMSIAAKEARETRYWLRLLGESEVLTKAQLVGLLKDCHEIVTVLNSIILTTRNKLRATSDRSLLRTQNSELKTSPADSELTRPNSALRTQHLELSRRSP